MIENGQQQEPCNSIPQGVLEAWQEAGVTGLLTRPGAVGGVGWARLCQQVCAVTQLIPPPC